MTNNGRKIIKRLTALLLSGCCSFVLMDPNTSEKIAPEAIVKASAAGSTITTTVPYVETTTEELTTTTSEVTTTTTSEETTTTTSEATTTTTSQATTTTTSEATTTTTSQATTTTTFQATTTAATTTVTTQRTGKGKAVSTSVPYTAENGNGDVITNLVPYGPQLEEPAVTQHEFVPGQNISVIPHDVDHLHLGYLPAGKSFYQFAKNWHDACLIAEYNGYSLYETVAPGWYFVPDGMACRVETFLYIPSGMTLFGVVQSTALASQILDYNGGVYTDFAYVPANMTLWETNNNSSVSTSAVSELVTTQTATGSETTTTTLVEATTTQSNVTGTEDATTTTTTTTAATETEETINSVESTIETEITEDKELQKLAEELLNKEHQWLDEVAEKEQLLSYVETLEMLISGDINKMIDGLSSKQAGFCIGTDKKIFLSFNPDGIFSVNCVAKPAVITLLLTECEKHGIDIQTTELTIQDRDWVYSTWINADHGFKIGDKFSLMDLSYCCISMSDNVSYNVIKRYIYETFGIKVDTWRLEKFQHYMDGGSYGKASARSIYAEAQYVLNYITSKGKYSQDMANWLNMEGLYFSSPFLDGLAEMPEFRYTGFKLGWYNETQTEMVLMQDQYGNWYIAVFLTKTDGDSIMGKVAALIDTKYRQLLKLIRNPEGDNNTPKEGVEKR